MPWWKNPPRCATRCAPACRRDRLPRRISGHDENGLSTLSTGPFIRAVSTPRPSLASRSRSFKRESVVRGSRARELDPSPTRNGRRDLCTPRHPVRSTRSFEHRVDAVVALGVAESTNGAGDHRAVGAIACNSEEEARLRCFGRKARRPRNRRGISRGRRIRRCPRRARSR